ncbi:m-AAA protease-interacting protein 1, mitochondrial [Uranotaenia lowii]|uniref:m-AAA protease-interacting protein 1, mitochondrial n=1 Tax=Uranotaenia lowii TaxID=190385 RepID=UPI00247A3207|nr:m-AAA protease-interacting protein 1, mitochondrial [Uranotaenia lowii]
MFLNPRLLKLPHISRFVQTISVQQSKSTLISARSLSILAGTSLIRNIPSVVPNRSLPQIVLTRSNSNDHHQPEESSRKRPRMLPTLMDFPEIVWPSVMKSIKNWIMVQFIIRPYFDREFSLPDFVQGAKQALMVVSASLAGGELKNLDGLVDYRALNDLKNSVTKLSVAQRFDLQVNKDDIYFSFPYQVGVMFDEENEESQKRYVEITMVFHVLKGLRTMVERGEQIPLNIGVMPEYRDRISICNYRFIKEFTKGVESDWTVNVVNHFKPSDLIDE